jgi:predicted amidohydrolase YtcJ
MGPLDSLEAAGDERFVLTNARLLVPDPGGRRLVVSPADALVIEKGAIVGLVRSDEMRRGLAPRAVVIELGGATVAPGFIDAHVHAFDCALNDLTVPCLPPSADSMDVIVERLRARASSLPADSWVVGTGYDDARLAERRHPSRDDLDAAAADHPVLLTRVCGHMSVANSRALELAGIGPATPDPEGGAIVHDATGRPTGLLLEQAQSLVKDVLPPVDDSAILAALSGKGSELLAHGITSIGEALLGAFHPREIDLWRDVFADGWEGPEVLFFATPGLLEARDVSDLPVIGTKLFADGVVTGRTAWLEDAYEGSDAHGMLIHDPQALTGLVAASIARGLPVGIHSMGDRGIATAIASIVEAQLRAAPLPRPHRIEHCSLPGRESLDAMSAHGIVPVPQPVFLYAEGEAYLSSLGAERCAHAYPLRTMIDRGLSPALSSDAPATSWEDPLDPWLGVATAAIRRTWAGTELGTGEVIDVAEALAAYTINGARALGIADRTGSIEIGKDADLIVLQSNPLDLPPTSMPGTGPIAVLTKGRLVHGSLP